MNANQFIQSIIEMSPSNVKVRNKENTVSVKCEIGFCPNMVVDRWTMEFLINAIEIACGKEVKHKCLMDRREEPFIVRSFSYGEGFYLEMVIRKVQDALHCSVQMDLLKDGLSQSAFDERCEMHVEEQTMLLMDYCGFRFVELAHA